MTDDFLKVEFSTRGANLNSSNIVFGVFALSTNFCHFVTLQINFLVELDVVVDSIEKLLGIFDKMKISKDIKFE